jgi:nucleotide-binding universal stress UspA family protein
MTVLLSYTPAPAAEAAVPAAIRQAQLREVPLVVLNVQRGGALVEANTASDGDLADVVRRATEAGVSASVRQSENADVVEGVLDAIEELNADVLVIGLRHRSPVGKLLLGSVAQRLILDAPCEVLAVKPIH